MMRDAPHSQADAVAKADHAPKAASGCATLAKPAGEHVVGDAPRSGHSATIRHLTPPLKIALNAMFLDPGVSGGPETYLRGLVPALASQRPDVEFVVVTTRRGASALRREPWTDAVTVVVLPADDGQRGRASGPNSAASHT